MRWLKIQKLEYLENDTLRFYETRKFLKMCLSDDTSYCFAAEITFTFPYSNDYTIDVKIAVSLF